MRRAIQIALTALYLLIFSNSILTAPITTTHALSPLSNLTHPSYGLRLACGINAHHTSSQHIRPPSALAYSYRPGRFSTSDYESKIKKECQDIVEEAKTPGYENRKAVGINAHHTSAQHNFQSSVLAYSYPPGRLYDTKTPKLGSLSPEKGDGYRQEETKHVPSYSSVPEYDAMLDRDELSSSWILMHYKVPYEYINHSNLFTENVFEWALWLLGLALVVVVGMEILSVWNRRMERFIMEGTEDNSEDDDGVEGLELDEQIKRLMEPKKTPTKDPLRSLCAKVSIMTSQYEHNHSAMKESTDSEEDVDENGMEKSSW